MKEKVTGWVNSCNNKKEIFYWIHFILFFMSNLNVVPEDYVRALILFMYILGLSTVLIVKYKQKYSYFKLIAMLGIYIILIILSIKYSNIHIMYLIATCIVIKELKFSKQEILSLINKTAIVYFILAIALNYTPLKSLSIYDIRQIRSRFLPHVYRFIGVNGSPAGPDILYLIVAITNLTQNKAKSKYFYIISSLIIVVWTASLSPIVALIGAIVIIPFSNSNIIKTIYSSTLWLYQYIVVLGYTVGSTSFRHILNRFSTTRSLYWYNVVRNLTRFSTFKEWLFGRQRLVGFARAGEIINNPHNFSIFLLEFGGVIMYSIIIIIATLNFKKIHDKHIIFIVSLLLIYTSTNTFIFTIRGNPIFNFILITYLFSRNEPKLSPSDITINERR